MPDLALPPLPQPPAEATIAALAAELEAVEPGLVLHRSIEERTRLSRDFHDYSPVLTPLLAGKIAQLAVVASTVEQVMSVAAACARHGVPLTLRGAGTGNYGQCVPLAGGVVLDLTGLNRVRRIDPSSGVLEAEAGCRLAELDGALAPHGRALRMAPSTWRSATLGGFIAGGSGGIGSVRWGFLRDPGNLLALEVVTVEPQPRLLTLEGGAAQPLNHAYGTNGILTAVTVATAPAVAWQQVVVDFPDWWAALEVARTLPGTALELDDLTLLQAPLAAGLPWTQGCPPPAAGQHRLLLLAAPDALPLLPAWLAERGGTLSWQQPQGSSRGGTLRELTWNHTTLHWRARHKGWTYLQLTLPLPERPLLEAVAERWGERVLWHLEGVRQGGSARLSALPVVQLSNAAELAELINFCRDHGAGSADPHVLSVEDGGSGVVDPNQVAAKTAHDPAGLLNPGKLRGWVGLA
jgi:FAD/FMN-containing dehydrogenase